MSSDTSGLPARLKTVSFCLLDLPNTKDEFLKAVTTRRRSTSADF